MGWLVVAGATVFLLLGLLHGAGTLQSTPERGAFTPTEAIHREAFQVEGSIGIAPNVRMSLWKAWVGFNLSHSLGVIVVAVAMGLPVVRYGPDVALADPVWVAAALALPAVYLLLSLRYWFDKPTQGIAFGTLLVYAGVLGGLAQTWGA